MIQITTLGFLVRYETNQKISKVCLGMKKTGFGVGKWNGFGGKVGDKVEYSSETIEECLGREAKEEFGIDILDFNKIGIIDFEYIDHSTNLKRIKTHIFLIDCWLGEVVETQEMSPRWFDISSIPFDAMWEDDKYWFPKLLKKEYFEARFDFKDNKVSSYQFK